jgi:uncharacterized protein (DUF488 family)
LTNNPANAAAAVTVYSIGHGNRSASDFTAQLRAAGVACLLDVRAYPSSRRHPQFTRMALEPALRAAGIRYLWEGQALGGMRRGHDGSPHTALTDPAMRGYADHMASREFNDAVARLLKLAAETPLALMCAERDHRHCHRAFIADALLLAGAEVLHLVDLNDVRRHALSEGARLAADGTLVYDAGIQMGLALRQPDQ